jgi:hypothetical protein
VKFSKSILIFSFFSSFLGAFYYALLRNDGNWFKSFQFAIFILAIKVGFIAPNILREFNKHQPNQQLLSPVRTLTVYNPYVSILDQ